jgi:hypothetical protein
VDSNSSAESTWIAIAAQRARGIIGDDLGQYGIRTTLGTIEDKNLYQDQDGCCLILMRGLDYD